MLNYLIEYAKKQGLAVEPGFSPKWVRWAINLDSSGNFSNILPLGEDIKGEFIPDCPDLTLPELIGGTETRCHFLVETTQVVALLFKGDEEPEKKEKILEKHRAFRKMLEKASETAQSLSKAASVLGDTDQLARIQAELTERKARPADKVTISVSGTLPVRSQDWHEWWRTYRSGLRRSSDIGVGKVPCFLTGELIHPAETHPKISGLGMVGGLPTGDALICFDKQAFSSYGFEKSANAAMSENAAKVYREGLNKLIREHSRPLAGTLIVHWFKEPTPPEDDALGWLEEPPEQRERAATVAADELLSSLREGRRPELMGNRYYALTISGAAGRVMVRDWMEGAFEELVHNVRDWFEDLSITRIRESSLAPFPKLERVVTCLLPLQKPKQDYRDWIRPIGSARTALLTTAIQGRSRPIPIQVLTRVTLAMKSFFQTGSLEDALEDGKSRGPALPLLYARMALIKAYHIRKARGGTPMSPYLNEEHPDPAYHCGRLLAVLAELQWTALGDVKAGVIQRYYAATSQAPALLIGRLIANAKNHLSTIAASRPKLAYWHEQRIADIMTHIGDRAPRTLDLERQSLFALGYYQQIAQRKVSKPGKNEGTEDEING
jgi:CRISPR-associated protein Csd1